MNFLRTLQAPPNPLLERYDAATGHAVQNAVADNQHVFAAMAFFAEHPGVPDHTDPNFPDRRDPAGAI